MYSVLDVLKSCHYLNDLCTIFDISHCIVAVTFVSSSSTVRFKKGFAFVPFFAIDRAITNAGIAIPFRFTQRSIGLIGGIFPPGRRPSCTYGAYSLVFTSSHLSQSNRSRNALRKNPVTPTGVSFFAVPDNMNIDFFIPAFSAETTASESNFCIDESSPLMVTIIVLLLQYLPFYDGLLPQREEQHPLHGRIFLISRVYQLHGFPRRDG